MIDHASEAQRYQILATQAANNLADEWITQMRALISTTNAASTCVAMPQGLRELTTRLLNTLEVTSDAADAIIQRAKVTNQVSVRKAEIKSAHGAVPRLLSSLPK